MGSAWAPKGRSSVVRATLIGAYIVRVHQTVSATTPGWRASCALTLCCPVGMKDPKKRWNVVESSLICRTIARGISSIWIVANFFSRPWHRFWAFQAPPVGGCLRCWAGFKPTPLLGSSFPGPVRIANRAERGSFPAIFRITIGCSSQPRAFPSRPAE